MNRIDTHQHVVPPRYAEWLREKGIRPGGVDVPDWSESAALEFMDGHGIQTGILSLSTPGVYFGDVAEAQKWAREINEYCAGVRDRHPDRFGFFATLPMPGVDSAIEEAEYALDVLGADGIVLLANYDGRYLGDETFVPLLEFLHQRGAVVFVHPGELPAEPVPGIPGFTADFLLDTTRTAISLILSGAMQRYANIRFILAHSGGFVPYIAYRILLTMVREGLAPNLDVLKQFYYDVALSATPAALPSLLEVADPEHITYGSDFPFAPPVAVAAINGLYEKYPLDPAQRAAIDRGNAEALFPRLKGLS
ncbi:amidohydrolase family protein [Lentzea sp. NPDC005914]|uniref:amidohydrolase family protein n=1 Tax=Lentzea sp. NPDC005914 TaxID=3154572 RepID=UPI0033EBBCE9